MKPVYGLLIMTAALSCPGDIDIRVQYPYPHVICQRRYDTGGFIRIKGRISGVADPGRVEARFLGGDWQEVDARPDRNHFSGTIKGQTGQGRLEVRCSGYPDSIVAVDSVAVGDVFVIAGQSNADGRGLINVAMDEKNPVVGVKFRAGKWSRGDDPSDAAGTHASPWPIVLNQLIPKRRVPMGFIQSAVGSTVAAQWRKGGDMYARMSGVVSEATAGTLEVKAVFYYQGENDITHHNTQSVLGDYAKYKEHLIAVVADIHALLDVPVYVGQITNLLDFRARNDAIRRAQQEIWSECEAARQGAVTYDIRPADGVHYRSAEEMNAFAMRWAFAIDNGLYQRRPVAAPKLLEVRRFPGNRLRIRYDKPLEVGTWDGAEGTRPFGFRIVQDDGSQLGDDDVASAETDGTTVNLRFRKAFSNDAVYCYGSGSDGQGKAVLRDAETGLPVPMVFSRRFD